MAGVVIPLGGESNQWRNKDKNKSGTSTLIKILPETGQE